MPTVYIVNKGVHDHSDAERFGKLEFLSSGSVNRFATSRMYREFVEKLKDSKPEDYILPTGLTIMSIIACSIFAHMHGRVNLLVFKSANRDQNGHYVERQLMLDSLLEEMNDEAESERRNDS